MHLETFTQLYQNRGFAALSQQTIESAEQAMVTALAAFSDQQLDHAVRYVQQAVDLEPANHLYRAARTYLETVHQRGTSQVYISPEGFTAFIRGGGNLALYQNTSAALAEAYHDYDQLHLLDIGVGDGMALLPALNAHVAYVTAIEPSSAMLKTLESALIQRNIAYSLFNGTIQDFIACNPDTHWRLAQATFSLQSLEPTERTQVLAWLAQHCDRLLIVEFDVPIFQDLFDPARVRYVLERYQQGIAEYPNQPEVIQGFLMPVMFGYFDRTLARTNYEQPIAMWQKQLKTTGFKNVQSRKIAPYWWADAWMIYSSNQ